MSIIGLDLLEENKLHRFIFIANYIEEFHFDCILSKKYGQKIIFNLSEINKTLIEISNELGFEPENLSTHEEWMSLCGAIERECKVIL